MGWVNPSQAPRLFAPIPSMHEMRFCLTAERYANPQD